MANQDVDILARKIVSLERRHAALARAQQLPSSSVRLAEGGDVMLPSAIQNGEDAYSEAGIIGDRADSMGDLIDSEVEYGTYFPGWLGDIGVSSDIAWDSTQFATDLSMQLETELGEVQLEFEIEKQNIVAAMDKALEAEGGVAGALASISTLDTTLTAKITTAQDRADDAFADAATASTEASLASGKLTLSGSAPAAADATGKPSGSMWIRNVAGAISGYWELVGSTWTARPLAETIIPQVAIGTGTYGDLDGVRLGARTVTADKVLISSGQNESWDPSYTAWNTPAWGNPSGGSGTGWSTDVLRAGMTISQKLCEHSVGTTTMSLYGAMRLGLSAVTGANLDRALYVGDRIGSKITAYAHFYADKTPPTGMTSMSVQVYFYNAAGSNFSNQNAGRINRADVVPGEWLRVGGTHLTVPAGAVYAIIRPTIYHTNNTTEVNGTNYYLGGEEMYWANAGELIVDGSITGDHVNANSVAAKLGEFITVKASNLIADTGAMNQAFIGQLVGDAGFLTSLYSNRIIVDAQDFAPGPGGGYSSAYELGADAFYSSSSNDPTGGAIYIRPAGASAAARMAWGPSTPISEGEWITWESYTSPNVTGASGPTGTNWSTVVYWYQSDGTAASTQRTFITTETSSGGTAGWSRGTVQAPAGTAYARVRFYSASGSTGSWFFRNFKIRKQVGAVLIEDGAVTADKLSATSIDGMTITGALLRTAASGQRVQLDVNGLRTFNSANQETVRLSSAGSGMRFTSTQGVFHVGIGEHPNRAFEVSGGPFIGNVPERRFSFDAVGGLGLLMEGNFSSSTGQPAWVASYAADSAQVDSYRNWNGGLSAPYAMAAGNVNTGASGVTTVTYPAGRFTRAPHVFASVVNNSGVCMPHLTGVSGTVNFEARIFNHAGVQAAGGIRWHAVQMTPSAANG